MALNARQQLTIKHLTEVGFNSREDIVNWCQQKMRLPHRGKNKKRSESRKHGLGYYQGIIDALR